MSSEKISVGVVGVGGWGKNLARNYSEMPGVHLKYLCDLDEAKLGQLEKRCKPEHITTDINDLLNDEELQAVVIATTGPTHYEMCKMSLLAGKDVYVEKPFVLASREARELISLAEERSRVLMVGHLLEYHPVVEKL